MEYQDGRNYATSRPSQRFFFGKKECNLTIDLDPCPHICDVILDKVILSGKRGEVHAEEVSKAILRNSGLAEPLKEI